MRPAASVARKPVTYSSPWGHSRATRAPGSASSASRAATARIRTSRRRQVSVRWTPRESGAGWSTKVNARRSGVVRAQCCTYSGRLRNAGASGGRRLSIGQVSSRGGSEWDVAVPALRHRGALAAQRAQGTADVVTGLARGDHGVDVPALGGEIGRAVRALVGVHKLGPQRLGVLGGGEFTAVQGAPPALGAPHRAPRGGAGRGDVGAPGRGGPH